MSGGLLVLYGLPEFLVATLLVVLFGGGLFGELLPVVGLRSEGSESWSALAQLGDLARHLVLPVLTLAVAPCVVVARFLRESVARAARSDFVLALRGWGMPERYVRRRALRNGLSPLVTLAGTLPPALVGGSGAGGQGARGCAARSPGAGRRGLPVPRAAGQRAGRRDPRSAGVVDGSLRGEAERR